MIRWLLSTLGSLGWYVVLASGWVCWFRAHRRAAQLHKELTVMAHRWRYAARKERV